MIDHVLRYAVVIAAFAALLRWLRPRWSRQRLMLATALPGAIALPLGGIALIAYVWMKLPGTGHMTVDGTGIAIVAAYATGAAVVALVIGLTVARIVYGLTGKE